MRRYWWLIPVLLLALWLAADFTLPSHSSLIQFDGHAVGRLEADMWRSYYEHHSVRLFGQLIELLRQQYHVPFWRSVLGAYYAAHAAIVFQRGTNRGEYERALPDLVRYYALIRRQSDVAFPVEQTARLELEWWIIHRQRNLHPPGDLEQSLAVLQAEIYQKPADRFTIHAQKRAEAMLLRDQHAETGGVSEADWWHIAELLDTSWSSLQTAVAH